MKMRKIEKIVFAVLVAMSILAIGVLQANATDVMINGKISTVTQKIDKSGNAYTILVIPETKELNGVKYTSDTVVVCFKSVEAKLLKAGDPVKLIAKKSVSKNGNESMTLITFVK